MSVSSCCLEPKVVEVGVVAEEGAEEAYRKEGCANDYVSSVEACCHEEGRAECAVGDGEW